MKKCLLLLCLICISLSCSNDEVGELKDGKLAGEWLLTDVSCFCFFEEDTNFAETRLIFDTNENTVTVQNSGSNTFFKESDTYTYTGEGTRIKFSDGTAYTYNIEGTLLQLDFVDNPDIADDEVLYSFRSE